MSVLSLQSAVTYGHVGNGAAIFPLQRLGIEVWAVDTARYGCHKGYGSWTGGARPAGEIRAAIDDLAARGALARCDAVLTGYLGDGGSAAAALEAIERVRALSPGARYLCDPVMGAGGRFFVPPEVRRLLAGSAIPAADVATPNGFELGVLAGAPVGGGDDAVLAAADRLRARGPGLVAVKGLRRGAGVAVVAVGEAGAWRVETPFLDTPADGAGDLFSALFLGRLLKGEAVPEALSRAVSATYAVVEETFRRSERELQIVAAQDAIVGPKRLFRPEKIR